MKSAGLLNDRDEPGDVLAAPGGSAGVIRGHLCPGISDLKKHEKNLERMEADRHLDNEHTRQAQEEFRKGAAELSEDDAQRCRTSSNSGLWRARSRPGKNQKTLAHQSFKEAVQKYGSGDPRSAAARDSWKAEPTNAGSAPSKPTTVKRGCS